MASDPSPAPLADGPESPRRSAFGLPEPIDPAARRQRDRELQEFYRLIADDPEHNPPAYVLYTIYETCRKFAPLTTAGEQMNAQILSFQLGLRAGNELGPRATAKPESVIQEILNRGREDLQKQYQSLIEREKDL